MEEKFFSAIEKYNMFRRGDKVAAAVSGGADSVALLHLLYKNRERLGIEVKALHFNHKLRGAESDRDEAFVRELCESLQITLSVGSADVKSEALANKESVELAARRARYAFFERSDSEKIATAHTASDNAETVLFNLSRGSGARGMRGIPPVRGRFCRPLIFCTREEIEAYCEKNSLSFVTDSTNLTDDCTRNLIRHHVSPVLKSINPAFERAVGRMCESIREDEALLEKLSREYIISESEAAIPENAPRPLASRALAALISERTSRRADSLHIENIISLLGSRGKTELFSGFEAVIDGERVKIRKKGEKPRPVSVEIKILSRAEFEESYKINKLLLKNAIDCDKISGKVEIRTRLAGDKIKLCGRAVTKELRVLYNERHIPPENRYAIPVAADERGVLWVCGFGADERVRIDKNTKRVMIFRAGDDKLIWVWGC